MLTMAPLVSTSLQPLESSLPSVCTWDVERPAGSGLSGVGICPGWFFSRASTSKYPRPTDCPNCYQSEAWTAGCFFSPAGLSSVGLSQLCIEALCLRRSLWPSFHGQVWELTELKFTHIPCDFCIIQALAWILVSFCLILYVYHGHYHHP